MRAINKLCDKATAYKEWIDSPTQKEEEYCNFYSNHKYCKDIKANLLLIQNGVCAYTEISLDDTSQLRDEDWKDGVYNGNNEFQGHLDHFDSSKKKLGKESWLWDNFFLVHGTINNVKNNCLVYNILKPDRVGYNPMDYIDYDIELNIFFVSDRISDPQQKQQIAHMIDKALCLNYGFIRRKRIQYLGEVFAEYYAAVNDIESIKEVKQFFTAFEITRNKIIDLENIKAKKEL